VGAAAGAEMGGVTAGAAMAGATAAAVTEVVATEAATAAETAAATVEVVMAAAVTVAVTEAEVRAGERAEEAKVEETEVEATAEATAEATNRWRLRVLRTLAWRSAAAPAMAARGSQGAELPCASARRALLPAVSDQASRGLAVGNAAAPSPPARTVASSANATIGCCSLYCLACAPSWPAAAASVHGARAYTRRALLACPLSRPSSNEEARAAPLCGTECWIRAWMSMPVATWVATAGFFSPSFRCQSRPSRPTASKPLS